MKNVLNNRSHKLSTVQKLHRVALTMGAAIATFVMGIWSKPSTVHADTTDHNLSTSSADDLNQSAAATSGNITSAVPTNQVLTTENVTFKTGDSQVQSSNNYALHDQSGYQPHATRVKRTKKVKTTVTSTAVDPTSTASATSNSIGVDPNNSDPSMVATSASTITSTSSVSNASQISDQSATTSSVVSNVNTSGVSVSADSNVVSASNEISNSSSSQVSSDAVDSTTSSASVGNDSLNDWTPLSSGLANDAIKTMVKPIFATNDNPDQPTVGVTNQNYYGLNQSDLTLPVSQYDQETSLYSIDPNAGQKYFGQMVQLTQDAQQHSTFDFEHDSKAVKADYGSQFLVRDVIVKNGVARFLLDNGMYLTANVNYVKLVNNLTDQA